MTGRLLTQEQVDKILSTPNYFKMTDQRSFECDLPSCQLYHDEKKICKSLRKDKNLCDDCWEGAMDNLAPWNND
mgnify:CR=1 FL=1